MRLVHPKKRVTFRPRASRISLRRRYKVSVVISSSFPCLALAGASPSAVGCSPSAAALSSSGNETCLEGLALSDAFFLAAAGAGAAFFQRFRPLSLFSSSLEDYMSVSEGGFKWRWGVPSYLRIRIRFVFTAILVLVVFITTLIRACGRLGFEEGGGLWLGGSSSRFRFASRRDLVFAVGFLFRRRLGRCFRRFRDFGNRGFFRRVLCEVGGGR